MTWHCSSISEDIQRFARNLGLIIENMGLSHIQLAVIQINLDISIISTLLIPDLIFLKLYIQPFGIFLKETKKIL